MKHTSTLRSSVLKFILISLLVHFISEAFSQNAVTTLAGSSQGFADATGTSAKFSAPTGLCLSPDGTALYIADYSGHRIRKINTATRAVTTLAGNGTSGYVDATGTAAKFSYPSGICITPDGTSLYVSDYGNSYIRKIDIATQAVSTVAGNGTFAFGDNVSGLSAAFNGPTDVVISGDSILFISDTENHLIRKYNIGTTAVSTLAGMTAVPGFQNGIGTAAAFRFPKGLAISEDCSALYIADNGNHMIRAISLTTANVTTVAGDGTAGYSDNALGALARFSTPNGVSIVPGNPDLLYIADNGNHRIRKITLSTTAVSSIAGDGSVPPASTYADNAAGVNAKFFYPTNLRISPDGQDIFVTDQGNFRVRKVKTGLNAAIEEANEALSLEIFPNPSSGKITIISNIQNEELSLGISSMEGKLIRSKNIAASFHGTITEDLSVLPAGNYLLSIFSPVRFTCKRITIIK